MSVTAQLSRHVRELHFGGNWTWSNLRDQLSELSWQQATTKIDGLNTIVALTYHINYFVEAALKVLHERPLDSKDAYSFDHPPINNQDDWQRLLDKVWREAEEFAVLVEQLPESKLWEVFDQEKYGSYFRNVLGIIEHSHYHLGQIAVVKKLVLAGNK